jgi:hypothetical protein
MATKDLFRVTFNEFSEWGFDEYHKHFVERLPFRFLEPAVIVNPTLVKCKGYNDLLDKFSDGQSKDWRNTELFPYLNFLNLPSSQSALQSCVDALRIHTGLASLKPGNEVLSAKKYWRIREAKSPVVVCSLSGKEIDCIVSVHNNSEYCPVIYSPYPDLFCDIEKNLYRGEDVFIVDNYYATLAEAAFAVVKRYSIELVSNLLSHVTTVAFMPPNSKDVKSFSKRNLYIGGIFVSARSVISVAEQFIHEYYHQVLWPWWIIESPRDLPNDLEVILSPVTGKSRPVSVMIQALLIYKSLKGFYSFVLGGDELKRYCVSELEEAAKRFEQISRGMEDLVSLLRDRLRGHPESLRLIDIMTSVDE